LCNITLLLFYFIYSMGTCELNIKSLTKKIKKKKKFKFNILINIFKNCIKKYMKLLIIKVLQKKNKI